MLMFSLIQWGTQFLDLLQLAFENTCRILLTQSGLYRLKQLKRNGHRQRWGGEVLGLTNEIFCFCLGSTSAVILLSSFRWQWHIFQQFFQMTVTYISTVLPDDSDIYFNSSFRWQWHMCSTSQTQAGGDSTAFSSSGGAVFTRWYKSPGIDLD